MGGMEVGHSWFAFVQTIAIAGGFFLMGISVCLEARARRAGNLIQLTQQHRDLWERMYLDPQLSRILDPRADLLRKPVTASEEMFAVFLILHLSSTFYAMRAGFFRKPRGLRKDIEGFFSLPIPRAVWSKVKILQERPFVTFVENCLNAADPPN